MRRSGGRDRLVKMEKIATRENGNTWGRTLASLKRFLYENRWGLVLAFCFTLICYGFMLTHYTLTIDEETWICNSDPALIEKLWLKQGRFGLYLFDAVFTPLGRYVPFVWDFLGIVFWFAGGVVFSFCLSGLAHGAGRWATGMFTAMFTTVPLAVGEILSYSMFSLQQGLAMLFVSLSVLCAFLCFDGFRWPAAVGAVLFLFAGTSFYQAFAVVYITAAAAYLCLSLMYRTGGRVFHNVFLLAGMFAVGVGIYFSINYYITNVLYPGSDAYLMSKFVGWEEGNMLSAFTDALGNVGNVIMGYGIYGGKALRLLTVLSAAAFCIRLILLIHRREGRAAVGLVVGYAVLFLAPFSMQLVFAQPAVIGRTLLALPLSLSVQAFLIVDTTRLLRRAAGVKWIAVGLLLCVLLGNAVYMNAFFYKSYRVYTEDQNKAMQIVNRLEAEGMNTAEKPVVFIGMLAQNVYLPADCSAGGSFFAWDNGNIARMHDFLKAEGYTILSPDATQIQDGVRRAENMPCWPDEGCVVETDGYILVKFSDPSYPWDIVNGAEIS